MSVWSSTGPCLRNKATQCCLPSHCSSLARKNPNQHIKQQRFALFLWMPWCACLAVQQDIRGNGDTRTIIQARVLYEPLSAAETGPSTTRLLVPSSVNLHGPGVEEDKEAVHLAPSDAPDWMKRTRCCSPRGCDSVCFSRSGWCWCCTERRWGPGRPSMRRVSSLLPLSVGVRATRYGNNDCVVLVGVTGQDADI